MTEMPVSKHVSAMTEMPVSKHGRAMTEMPVSKNILQINEEMFYFRGQNVLFQLKYFEKKL